MKPIDIDKIRGRWQDSNMMDGLMLSSGGDDTIESIKMVAEKVNEIVEWIESKKDQLL